MTKVSIEYWHDSCLILVASLDTETHWTVKIMEGAVITKFSLTFIAVGGYVIYLVQQKCVQCACVCVFLNSLTGLPLFQKTAVHWAHSLLPYACWILQITFHRLKGQHNRPIKLSNAINEYPSYLLPNKIMLNCSLLKQNLSKLTSIKKITAYSVCTLELLYL